MIKQDNSIHHLAWCIHSSEECHKGKGTGEVPATSQASSNNADSRTGLNKQLLAHLAELSIQDE